MDISDFKVPLAFLCFPFHGPSISPHFIPVIRSIVRPNSFIHLSEQLIKNVGQNP